MYEEIVPVLKKIGLTEAEAKVYLALLQLGETKTGEIIKKMGLKSSTIYLSLNKLIQFGLISYVTRNKIKHYKAVPPERLKDLFHETEKEIEEIIPKLKLIKKKEEKITKVEIYEGYNGIRDLTLERLKLLKKGDEIYIIIGEKSYLFEKYKALWKRHEIEREKKGIKIKLIIPKESKKIEKTEFRYKGRYVKYIEPTLPSTFIVWKNVVDISILDEGEGKDLMIHIEDERVAETYKHYFDMMWILASKD